jgi:hypothetical protein
VQILEDSGYVIIHDQGKGYPIVLAKRIGASSKKDDPLSIGQFGEGSKLAILTCIRKGLKVLLSSQNWLIAPTAVESEDQEVLMYDIYEAADSITGSIVILEATPEVLDITNCLPEYFLHFNKHTCLFGNSSNGIYPLANGKAKLFNKGVYVREIDALYSYAISIEKLNRDRDLINHSNVAYKVRDIYETVDDKELIKNLMIASTYASNQRNNLIEFYCTQYSNHPVVWAEEFRDLYGQNACLFSDDIAQREAELLGYSVIRMEYGFSNILKSGGIKLDKEGLSDDFEFVFSNTLDREEKNVLSKLPILAGLAEFDVLESIKVFDEYKLHSDIPGLYNSEKQQIYLRRDILKSSFEEALYVFLHETCHHSTGADDISRDFADGLCRRLASILLKYTNEVGIDEEFSVSSKGLELPLRYTLSAGEMNAIVIVANDELIVKVADTTLRSTLPATVNKPSVWNRKIIFHNNRFVVSLPGPLLRLISSNDKLLFKVK